MEEGGARERKMSPKKLQSAARPFIFNLHQPSQGKIKSIQPLGAGKSTNRPPLAQRNSTSSDGGLSRATVFPDGQDKGKTA
jgi:hypothetical protein